MTDHLIPSVEDAAAWLWAWQQYSLWPCREPKCHDRAHLEAENRALALDMALAQASDRRRAADDELRRSVAW